ncbi:hypothetical protein ACW2Q0_08600 [Nocardia sp. R16R-3T]
MMSLGCARDTARDRVRGSLTGILCGVLAVAAHGFEGELPHSAALALLLLISGAVGAVVGSSAGRGRVRLFAALGAGQLLMHSALCVDADPMHAHAAAEGVGVAGEVMLAAHVGATVLCALIIAAVERVYVTVSRVMWTVLGQFDLLPADRDRAVRAPRAAAVGARADLLGAISLRGPPTVAAW